MRLRGDIGRWRMVVLLAALSACAGERSASKVPVTRWEAETNTPPPQPESPKALPAPSPERPSRETSQATAPAVARPVVAEARKVTREEFADLLRGTIEGVPEAAVDAATDALFRAPANSTTAHVNPNARFDAVGRYDGKVHRALVMRMSPQGFPLLPLGPIGAAACLGGVDPESARGFHGKIAERLAAKGRCVALAVFDNGNAVAVTLAIAEKNPIAIEVTSRFLRQGEYSEASYPAVVHGAQGVSSTGTKTGEVTRVPLIPLN